MPAVNGLSGPLYSGALQIIFVKTFFMKRILFLAVLGAVLMSVTSCKKDSGSGGSSNLSGPFVATVDGAAFPNADMTRTTAKFVTSTKMLQIIGQPADAKETIVLSLMNFDNTIAMRGVGDYDMNPAQVATGKYLLSAEYNKWNGSGYDQWFAEYSLSTVGKLTIESITDTHVKGSFYFEAFKKNTNGSFDASNKKSITQGSFDLDIKRM